ncbi:MAG: AAA family ATPase, partial [Cetobacterium sp.]
MIFKEIFIKNYRSLIEFNIKFDEVNDFYRNIYNNINLNVIAGENGSGKSSLLAFIASVFHNLNRYPERIESDFKFV